MRAARWATIGRPSVWAGVSPAKLASAQGSATQASSKASSASMPKAAAGSEKALRASRARSAFRSKRPLRARAPVPRSVSAGYRWRAWSSHRDRRSAVHDAARRVEIEQIQRQPSAEDARRRKALALGCEVLDRIERAQAALCRMKWSATPRSARSTSPPTPAPRATAERSRHSRAPGSHAGSTFQARAWIARPRLRQRGRHSGVEPSRVIMVSVGGATALRTAKRRRV